MSHPFFVLTPCFLFVPRSLPSVLFLLSVSTTASFLHQLFFISDFDSFPFASFTSRQLPFLYCLQSCCFFKLHLPVTLYLPSQVFPSCVLPLLLFFPSSSSPQWFQVATDSSISLFFCPLPVLQALHLYRQVLLFILLLFHVLPFKFFSSYKSTDKSNHTCMSPHPSSTLLFFFILPPLHVCMWSPRTVATAANPISQMSRPPMKGKA